MVKITRRNFAIGSAVGLAATALPGSIKYAFADDDVIRFGMTTALTGPYNEFGEGNKRGFDLAVDMWNAKGGINGRKIEIATVLDDQLVPDRAAQNMRRLLDDPKLVGIFGPAGSGPTLAVVDMVKADGRPYINPIAQTPATTYPDGMDSPPFPNIFSFGIMNPVEAEVLGKYVVNTYSKIGLLHESTGYGVSGRDALTKVMKSVRADAEVMDVSYDQRATDVTAQVVRLQQAEVDVVLVVGLGTDLVNIRRSMVRLGLEQPLVTSAGGLSLPYFEGAGDAAVGTIAPMVAELVKDNPRPEVTQFVEAYKAKYGVDRYWGPDPESPQLQMSVIVIPAYDGANIMFEGIRKAGSTDADKIIASIEGISNFGGANAIYTFSSQKHHAIAPDGLSMLRVVKKGDDLDLEVIKN